MKYYTKPDLTYAYETLEPVSNSVSLMKLNSLLIWYNI